MKNALDMSGNLAYDLPRDPPLRGTEDQKDKDRKRKLVNELLQQDRREKKEQERRTSLEREKHHKKKVVTKILNNFSRRVRDGGKGLANQQIHHTYDGGLVSRPAAPSAAEDATATIETSPVRSPNKRKFVVPEARGELLRAQDKPLKADRARKTIQVPQTSHDPITSTMS